MNVNKSEMRKFWKSVVEGSRMEVSVEIFHLLERKNQMGEKNLRF